MKVVATKEHRVNNLVKTGILLAFLSFSVFALYLLKNLEVPKKTSKTSFLKIPVPSPSNSPALKNSDQWEKYVNDEFGYSLLYPGFLVRREIKDSTDYLHFIRFEENVFSEGSNQKGVAVGVSQAGLGVETVRITKEMLNSGGELLEEKETKFLDLEAVRLDFEPKDPKIGEKKTVVVFFKNGMSYSISTVPSQIDKVLSGFKFF